MLALAACDASLAGLGGTATAVGEAAGEAGRAEASRLGETARPSETARPNETARAAAGAERIEAETWIAEMEVERGDEAGRTDASVAGGSSRAAVSVPRWPFFLRERRSRAVCNSDMAFPEASRSPGSWGWDNSLGRKPRCGRM